MKENTIIIPIISADHIGRALETLYKYTDNNFYVYVIDQTTTDEAYTKYHHLSHLWIKVYRNLGFSKAMNMGIKLAQTPYITLCNDDVEFMNIKWWQGILDTFEKDHHIIAVNPMSPKEGAWGYGLTSENKDTWQPPDEYVRDPEDDQSVVTKLPDGSGLMHKETFSEQEYEFLLKDHPRYKPDTMVDGIAMWCTVFKKSGFEKIGLLDEKFYPGGGEDYDMLARAYSCAWPEEREICDNEFHHRMVSTSLSWVWHKWSKSRKIKSDDPIFSNPRWNNNDELWPHGFDVWGHENLDNGKKKPYKRTPEITIAEL